MTSKSRGHCDNIKVFNQGKSNQIREKSGNLIAKNVWPPCTLSSCVTSVDDVMSQKLLMSLEHVKEYKTEYEGGQNLFFSGLIFFRHLQEL